MNFKKIIKKMKNFLLYIILLAVFASCESDLEKEPPFISESQIFEQEPLTEAYISDLYTRMNFQELGGLAHLGMGLFSAVGAEHINFANWQYPNGAYRRQYTAITGPGNLDRWAYVNIREMNVLIEQLPNSASLSQDYIDSRVAEVRFLRAYEYFEMVRRFGGVPIITKVLSQDDPEEEIFPVRNTEKEVYDFIYSELNDILPVFTDAKTGAAGRVDRYTVLMLQSRAMLYAASIANFGNGPELNGVVGISSGDAMTYYQRSYDASKAVMDSGQFSLVNDNPDKVENYKSIFLNEGNDEVIFAEVFDPDLKGHSFELLATPQGFSSTWNANFPVLYDFVELFDFTDGRTGMIPRDQLTADNRWDISDFFGNRDPRFRASVFYPEVPLQGSKVYFHTSTIYDDNGSMVESSNTNLILTRPDGEAWPAAAPPRNVRNTALLLSKRFDETNQTPELGRSGQDFYLFRYAETLLNFAEASLYLGTGEALDALNDIRERAGMPLLTEATEDNIRHERQIELCFEEHRFWDLIRWRAADGILNGEIKKGLIFKYYLDTNTYSITLKNGEQQERQFGPERYYLPFPQGRLADNPNLVQNPGY